MTAKLYQLGRILFIVDRRSTVISANLCPRFQSPSFATAMRVFQFLQLLKRCSIARPEEFQRVPVECFGQIWMVSRKQRSPPKTWSDCATSTPRSRLRSSALRKPTFRRARLDIGKHLCRTRTKSLGSIGIPSRFRQRKCTRKASFNHPKLRWKRSWTRFVSSL